MIHAWRSQLPIFSPQSSVTSSPHPRPTEPSNRWQAIALNGRNSWWRYLLGVFIFLVFMLIVGSIAALFFAGLVLTLQGVPPEAVMAGLGEFFTTASVEGFIGNNIPFLFGILALVIVLPLFHDRNFFSLLGASKKLQWQPLLEAFGLWFAIVGSSTAIFYLLEPSEFNLTFRWESWLPLLLVTVPLTFLQVACEELFFRGYILQGLGILIRSKVVLASIAAVPFALVHFANPEMQRGLGWMALYYLAFGLVTCWMTLKRDRLEPAIGFHLANNYFGILVVSSTDSVLPVPAIFTIEADGSAMFSVLLFIAEAWLFYGLLQRKLPWQRKRTSET